MMMMMNDLMFDGHAVRLSKTDDDVYIKCKNTIGLYSQLKAFFHKKTDIHGRYSYGVRNKEPMFISQNIHNSDLIQIACLNGTKDEAIAIAEACENLL